MKTAKLRLSAVKRVTMRAAELSSALGKLNSEERNWITSVSIGLGHCEMYQLEWFLNALTDGDNRHDPEARSQLLDNR